MAIIKTLKSKKLIWIIGGLVAIIGVGVMLNCFFTYKIKKMKADIWESMKIRDEVRDDRDEMLWDRIKAHYEILDYKTTEQEEKIKRMNKKINIIGEKAGIKSWEW